MMSQTKNMLWYVLLLFTLCRNSNGHQQHSSCPPEKQIRIKVSVHSYRNQTGHWISQVWIQNDPKSWPDSGRWNVEVEQRTQDYDDATPLIIDAIITSPPSLAGPGYELFPGIGRYKFHTTRKTWSEARCVCATEGAHLAIVNSEAESDVLKQLFDLYPLNNFKQLGNYAFIGFSDMHQEGHFITIFGEPLNQTGFTRWSSPGQPDNSEGRENCGSLHRNGGLNDIQCHFKLAFFCEQELW